MSNAAYEFLTEDDGNTYLHLWYNENANRDRTYFDVVAETLNSPTKIQVDYDVMYADFTEDRNGEVQIKNRTGPGSEETTMIARVAQLNGYLQVQGKSFQRVSSVNGGYLQMELNHWYRIGITVDLETSTQSIYVFDRDTGSLLGVPVEIPLIATPDYIGMVTFSSGTRMYLDNVRISEPTCENTYIYGSPYIKRGNKQRYYFIGKDMMDGATALPYGTTTWSIENPRNGVSINSSSGNLNTSDTVETGTVIVKATRTVGDVTYEAKYPVSIIN